MVLNILIILFVINILGASAFYLLKRKTGSYRFLSLFFLMIPIVGFLIYFAALFVWRLRNSFTYDRESLVHRVKFAKASLMPETARELDVIPVEDAMAISSNSEKRALMLDQLKKDLNNYKTILSASADEDSETAHYVAAAKLEIYNKLILSVKKSKKNMDNEFSKDVVYTVLECYVDMIESKVLAKEEVLIYYNKYAKCFEHGQELEDFSPNLKYHDFYIHCLIALGKTDKVKSLWDTLITSMKTENLYRELLEMYYNAGNKVEFYDLLDELCASDLSLSAEGVDMLRFWLKNTKREKALISNTSAK